MSEVVIAVFSVVAFIWVAFSIMKVAILGRKSKDIPKPGDKWVFKDRDDKSPWPSKYSPVLVTDVKDGWVRYEMSVFKDNRAEMDTFVRLYRKMQ